MKRLLLLSFIIICGWANIYMPSNNKNGIVLKELDIPQSFMKSYGIKLHERVEKYYKAHFFNIDHPQTYFVPGIVKLLNKAQVPNSLLFVALVESHFSIAVKSHKRAKGLWQFMEPTAKKYGLRIDTFIDERLDPFKSTKAAIAYLKELHQRFGKWYLALLAYNMGEGGLQRAVKRAGSDDLSILLDEKKKYLPKETRRYIVKILTASFLALNEESQLHKDIAYLFLRNADYDVAPVLVEPMQTLTQLSEQIKLDTKILKILNPHLKREFTPPNVKTTLYLPRIKLEDFKKYYHPRKRFDNFLIYKVVRGDSLYRIAHRYHTTVALIKEFNKLRSNRLRINQKLILPIPKKRLHHYKVQKGDTLIKIAKKFHISLERLKLLNHKQGDKLKIGEHLVVY